MTDKPRRDGTWPLAVIDGRPVAPCIGSGYCCKTAPCHEAAARGVREAPCSYLEHDGDRHWCGLIRSASPAEATRLRASLYIGAGCCSNLNSARVEMLTRQARSLREGK